MPGDLGGVVLKEKWRIDALLGAGGVATVYAATHRNGKRVAVKVLHPHLASMPEVRERFLREGYVANQVEHPYAVSVLDDDVTEDGLVFLVMDLLDGESLQERLEREGQLSPNDVLVIADALLDVLSAAHEKGIVHRDIKPDNVYLLRNGGLRLLDFGIARLHEQRATKNATQSGAAMGTPSYMPPEQARGRWEMVDARSDLWAVVATMFALLTGRCVHEAETVNETLLLAMSRPAPPLASVLVDSPARVAAIVDRALAFEMQDRWSDAPSMRQGVQDARRLLEALPTRALVPRPLPEATTPATEVARGTVLATSVSATPPVTARLLGAQRKRAVLGAGIGGTILVLLLVAIGRGKEDVSREATRAAASTALTAPAALSLPAVTLPPELPVVAPSASVEIDVSRLPPASAAASARVRPPVPVGTAAPTGAVPPPPARPVSAPTTNPLDRRR
jgi:serine/threonine protein kinase